MPTITAAHCSALQAAFPPAERAHLSGLARLMPATRLEPHQSIGPVTVDGHAVAIPFRIYNPEPNWALLGDRAEVPFLRALYTRHHDGYVRQAQLIHVLDLQERWVPPFVLQLVGEYVVEIVEAIRACQSALGTPVYQDFIAHNSAFMSLTRSRAISYWNCYYRRRIPRLQDYVGVRLLDSLSLVT